MNIYILKSYIYVERTSLNVAIVLFRFNMYSIYNIRAKLGSNKEKMIGGLDTVIDPIDGDKDEPQEFEEEEEESELHAE